MPSKNPESPATVTEFFTMFPDEQSCETYLFKWRWPDGFTCPKCGSSRKPCYVTTQHLWECMDCGRQTSVTAGTVMQHTKAPLRAWLYGLFCLGGRKTSISALQFQKEMGLGSYRTAWAMLHKIRRALAENSEFPLSRGRVEIDESQVGGGGDGSGRFGRRLGEDGSWIVVAVERLTVPDKKGEPQEVAGSARMAVVNDTSAASLVPFVKNTVAPGATLVTDYWASYGGLKGEGYEHLPFLAADKNEVKAQLPKVTLLLTNLKAWLNGTFHGVDSRYLWAYLREFTYRFNRRGFGLGTFGYLARRLVRGAWCHIDDLGNRPEDSYLGA